MPCKPNNSLPYFYIYFSISPFLATGKEARKQWKDVQEDIGSHKGGH
jgi:hypothetical protein